MLIHFHIESVIKYTIVIYSLCLLLPLIEWIIDIIGKSIIYILKNIIKIVIVVNTTILTYSWLMVLFTVIYKSFRFYINNGCVISHENLTNIAQISFKNIFMHKLF